MYRTIRKKGLSILITLAMLISLMPTLTLPAKAATTGDADGTYDFGSLGAADSGGTGFKTQGDKFKVSNVFNAYETTLYANNDSKVNTHGESVYAVIKAEGGAVNKQFSFRDMNLSTPAGGDNDKTLDVFTITLKKVDGSTIQHTLSTTVEVPVEGKNISTFPFTTPFPAEGYDNVTEIDITFSYDTNYFCWLSFNTITIANVSTTAAPTITGISLASGSTTGSTSVVITGTNFTGASAVSFGATPATSFTVNSATQITATSPAGSEGSVHITVTTGGVTSATSAADQFTYVAPAPEIEVKGNDTTILDGDESPSSADHTDFGSVATFTGTFVRTFTIKNTGSAALTLGGGSPYVTIGGTNAVDFSVTAIPAATIAASDSTTFQITFDPSAVGTRTATVSIANNDSDENPYNFTIQGAGTNSAPTVNSVTPDTISYTDTAASDTFNNTTGIISATDGDGSVSSYGILGETGCSYIYDSLTYNEYKTGTYGTLYVKSNDGKYVFVPNNTAINAVSTSPSETFTVTATDNLGATGNATLTVSITGANDTPTDIALSASSINENVAGNTSVGTLSSTDPDAGNTFT